MCPDIVHSSVIPRLLDFLESPLELIRTLAVLVVDESVLLDAFPLLRSLLTSPESRYVLHRLRCKTSSRSRTLG